MRHKVIKAIWRWIRNYFRDWCGYWELHSRYWDQHSVISEAESKRDQYRKALEEWQRIFVNIVSHLDDTEIECPYKQLVVKYLESSGAEFYDGTLTALPPGDPLLKKLLSETEARWYMFGIEAGAFADTEGGS